MRVTKIGSEEEGAPSATRGENENIPGWPIKMKESELNEQDSNVRDAEPSMKDVHAEKKPEAWCLRVEVSIAVHLVVVNKILFEERRGTLVLPSLRGAGRDN